MNISELIPGKTYKIVSKRKKHEYHFLKFEKSELDVCPYSRRSRTMLTFTGPVGSVVQFFEDFFDENTKLVKL